MEKLTVFIFGYSTLSIVMNLAVIYIILRYSSSVGQYKWVLAGYAAFEAFSAFIVVLVEPVHLVYDNTWMVISSSRRFEGTTFAKYDTGFYCAVLLVWLAITFYLFIYRYLVICQIDFMARLKHSLMLKLVLIFVAMSYVVYLFICGVHLCRESEVSQAMNEKLLLEYNISDINIHGYMLLRLVDNNGNISVSGTWGTANHIILHSIAAVAVIFCSTSIYRVFKTHANRADLVENIKVQRQLFRLLVVQSAIPLAFYALPGTFYVSFPFWHPKSSFGFHAPFMTMILVLPKLIDPIVTVLFITDYRRALRDIIVGRPERNNVDTISSSVPGTVTRNETTQAE